MSEKHLLDEIRSRFEAMTPSVRKAKIKKLVKSRKNEKFIKKYFPNFLDEAFPSSSAGGGGSELTPHCELSAKHR